MESILFYSFSSLVLISALLVISRVNPLISSLWLIITLASSAVLFAMLAAPFIAVLQILVYAGAIMVLFLFVVMLINLGPEGLKPREIHFRKVLGTAAVLYLLVMVLLILWRPLPFTEAMLPEAYGDPKTLGALLLTTYAVPFELASLLLLGGIVAAVVMGKKKL